MWDKLQLKSLRAAYAGLSPKRRWVIAESAVAIILLIAVAVIKPPAAQPTTTHQPQQTTNNSTTDVKGATDNKAGDKNKPELAKPAPTKPAPPPSALSGGGGPAAPAPSGPANVLNLTNWELTLPINTAHTGSPDIITQPELANYTIEPYFLLNDAKNGVVFQAHAGGATTSNSNYPRSELREMTSGGKQEASWSNSSGTHTMTIRQAITHVPAVKPHVVAGQIHDSSDDIIEIRLEDSNLFVESNGKNIGDLDGGYALGTPFTVKVVAAKGHIYVSYNGEQKVDYRKKGSSWYFKAGCYTQSNPSRGDSPDAFGQVIIYDLQVSHT